MLSTWRSDPDYVDAAGAPREIPRNGPSPSLEDLFTRTVVANPELEDALDRNTVIDILIASEVLDVRPEERFWPNRSWFKTNAPGAAAALTHLGFLAEFSTTVTRNTEIGGDGREHIITRVRRFPASMVSMVRAMIHDQGMAFIEMVDDFLEKERQRDLSAEHTVHIAVGLYLCTEDTKPQ